MGTGSTFRFRQGSLATASRAFGVTESNAFVDIDDERLLIRFGPWKLETPTSNIDGAEVTGPYQWWKVVGPARLSAKDRGITFATTAEVGVCIRFKEPVPSFLPNSILRHPGATVTVDEPEELVQLIEQVTRTR